MAIAPIFLQFVTTAGRQLIVHVCPTALAAGVQPGMTLAHAQALLPKQLRQRRSITTESTEGTEANSLITSGSVPPSVPSVSSVVNILEPSDPDRDAAALRALAHWAIRFSPLVAPDPPDGLWLDITGCAHLFGGERAMLHTLVAAVQRLGLAARAAIAPTLGCAWALARFGRREQSRVPEDRIREALAPLPVAALRLEPDILDALDEVGVRRIQHLFDLPRSALPARFGDDLLLRLDQATGAALETFNPIRPVAPVVAELACDGPCKQLEPIMDATRRLIDDLVAQLAGRERGARSLCLELHRTDASPVVLLFNLSRPSRDPKHLWTLLRPQVESVNLGFGVDRLTLSAPRLGKLPHAQMTRWRSDAPTDAERERQFAELLDVMISRLGPQRVSRLEAVETHIPERASSPLPPGEGAAQRRVRGDATTTGKRPSMRKPKIRNQRSEPNQKSEIRNQKSDRPSILFPHPEPIEVVAPLPEGPPSLLRRRGVTRQLRSTFGPERIGPEWWKTQFRVSGSKFRDGKGDLQPPASSKLETQNSKLDSIRDYFKVQDERGRWFWIFHELSTGRWFLHGEWG